MVRSYDILEDIRNQDNMAHNGLRTGLERAKEDKDKKAIRRLQYSIDSIISAYEFEGIKSDLSKWRMIAEKNMSDVLDMIFSSAIGAPAVVLDKLYVTTTGLCEPMKQDLASAEAYQKSAVASGITEDLQAVVTEAYGELFKGTGKNSFRSEKLDEFVELLYAYIKADYITRSYGLTAMIRQQNKNSNWSAEERRVEEDAKMLAVLAAYSDGTFRDPEEMHELFQSEMPQNFLMNYADLNTIYESACNTADQCSTPGGFYDFYMTEVGYVGGILRFSFLSCPQSGIPSGTPFPVDFVLICQKLMRFSARKDGFLCALTGSCRVV